ncbi:MAG: phosphate ABC transporter permease subunit PstC [Phycisphaerales bacterium JB063]
MTQLQAASRLLAPERRRSVAQRDLRELLIRIALTACGVFTIICTVLIIYVLVSNGLTFFGVAHVSPWQFFTGTEWAPLLAHPPKFGVLPLIMGTMLVAVIAMCVALPLGLLAAVWMSEYASPRARAIVKPTLELLAGIPTVVLGFFALMVITPFLQTTFNWTGFIKFDAFSAMSAGLAVGFLCLPTVCSLCEDALRMVPDSLRQGALGLGASRFETAVRVLIPAALSGIVSAFLLAMARAVGETMIVAIAAGSMAVFTADPSSQVQTITGHMVSMFLGDVSNFGVEYYSSYAVGAVLFFLTLSMTFAGHIVRKKYRQAYE